MKSAAAESGDAGFGKTAAAESGEKIASERGVRFSRHGYSLRKGSQIF